MRLTRLLREPLPDTLPSPTRHRSSWLRRLVAMMPTNMVTASDQAQVIRRVRRGAVQALVYEAYNSTVAEHVIFGF